MFLCSTCAIDWCPGYDERGLLGVAVHPNFGQHPFVYTYTSEPNGPMADFMIMMDPPKTNNCQSVVAEWRIDSANTNRLDPASRREILRLDKPQFNHNAGAMHFGKDGFLYFTVGDGGAGDDQGDGHSPGGNGQDKTKILGKLIRIDVDTRNSANGQYGIPSDNPFVNEVGSLPEIYAYGFRNPFSFSFDPLAEHGDVLVADVGQNDVEEADRVLKGANLGWPIKEGTFFFDPNGTGNGFITTAPVRPVPSDLVDPFVEYDHDEGIAILGGYLFRGIGIPALNGKYVFGDLGKDPTVKGRLFYQDGADVKEFRIGTDSRALGIYLKGMSEGPQGEIYVLGSTQLGPSGAEGKLLKIIPLPAAPPQNSCGQQNLVSDISGVAVNTDTNLVNPWGLAFGPTTPFWISDNGKGLSTLYNSTSAIQSLVVTLPTPAGVEPPSAPTGVVFNNTAGFNVGTSLARFIFATEEGTIVAWNNTEGAVVKVDRSAAHAIYKGLTLANNGPNAYLYAADFHNRKIDVFDSNFQAATLSGDFSETAIPANYAPFDVQNLAGKIYLSYAQQDVDGEDDAPGAGNGYLSVFDTGGNFLQRLVTHDVLNSPWGMTIAPASFGSFGGALLVGNFGDGRINAFDLATAASLGPLKDPKGNPISIQRLWDLKFGNGAQGGRTDVLYFTAGIAGDGAIEDHGLFGSLEYSPAFLFTQLVRNGNTLTLNWRGGTPPYLIEMKTDVGSAWTSFRTVQGTTTDITINGTAGFFRVSSATNPP